MAYLTNLDNPTRLLTHVTRIEVPYMSISASCGKTIAQLVSPLTFSEQLSENLRNKLLIL